MVSTYNIVLVTVDRLSAVVFPIFYRNTYTMAGLVGVTMFELVGVTIVGLVCVAIGRWTNVSRTLR